MHWRYVKCIQRLGKHLSGKKKLANLTVDDRMILLELFLKKWCVKMLAGLQ